MKAIETAKELEELQKRYPICGPFTISDNSCTFWSYDRDQNELKVTATKNEKIQYQETSVADRLVKYV